MRIEDNRSKNLKSFHYVYMGNLFAYDSCIFLKISETEAFCFEALSVTDFEDCTTVELLDAKIVIE